MKIKLSMLLAGVLVFAASCTDPDKDPFQIDKLIKGDILALRGTAFDNLFEAEFRGAVDKFSLATVDPATETFEFTTEYLSDEPNSLSEVQVYARQTDATERKRVTTVSGSTFVVPDGGKNPTTTITIKLSDILSAIGKSVSDLSADTYMIVELDAVLTDGTIVKASSVVNSSLFESATFYPAHKMRYLVAP